MNEALPIEEPAAETVIVRRRVRPFSLLTKGLIGLALALFLGAAAFLAFLDTAPGHRFIADKIADLAPRSGLRIVIGRIDGSIYGDTKFRNVRLFDPQGQFAEIPYMEVDWQPLAWITNRLVINDLKSDLVYLDRLPKLIPSEEPQPILPGFDIHIGRVDIKQIRIGKAVTGKERVASLTGEADIRAGRALVDLKAKVRGGGDEIALLLDAEPDRNRFDLDVRLRAPQDSVAGAIVGTRRPIDLEVKGDGSWARWTGTARLNLSGRRTADLALTAENGRYSLSGALAPSQFLAGKLQRLSAPRVLVNGNATLEDRVLDGRLSLRSAALRVETVGALDLAGSRFDDVRIGADLLRPPALFPNMTGTRVRLSLLLNGRFDRANFAYRITSPRVAFDQAGFEDVRAEGRGRLSKEPATVPLLFLARRVTGVGDVAGGILANLRVQGNLKVTKRLLTGEGLSLTSDKLKGRLGLLVDLVTGRYNVVLSGGLTRYLIPGLGIVDVTSELKVVPGPNGRGTLVTGTGRAWVRRLDNRFLASLAGGLPRIETGLVRGSDGVLHFRNLRLVAPSIRLAGNGYRRRDGTFHFEGSGNQAQYGPFAMVLDGNIARPKLNIRLQRPNEALGLRNVLLNLDPTREGFSYRAEGISHLGPFTSNGLILLPANEPALIRVAAINVSGSTASGNLRSDPGGFTGSLDVAGGGLSGRLLFDPVNNMQRIQVDLTAQDASFAGPPPITIRRGRVQGVVLLDPAGTSVRGSLSARGLQRGGLTIASIDAQANLRGGTGQVTANLAGTRGRAFVFRTIADIAPGRIRLTGGGTVDRRPIQLTQPAVFTKEEGGWRLAPTSLTFAGGRASVSGLFGGSATEVQARLDQMPLTVLDIAYPRLGLGGIASGTLNYRAPEDGTNPTGDMNLRIRGLTRSGLVLSSKPVDVGIAARLVGGNAAMRAVAVSEGRTVGRAQARISPITGGGDLWDRLSRAPLFAQLRYNGPADTLWRLTGQEFIDISGPAAIGLDARGTLDNPQIIGSVRTDQARIESPVVGTVIQNVRASGRFNGSRLVVDSFAGATGRGGTVSGRGSFDLAAANGYGMDLSIDTGAAQIVDRDDLKAQVTGPISIKSDGSGGTISGDVQLISGSFRLGSATAAAQVPRLNVRELNRPADEGAPPRAASPWRYNLKVRAARGLTVTGLGINSEWSADLDIGGTVTEPRIRGDAELVRGTYDFAGRRFDLERGIIRFQGESPPNPILDITAEGGVRGLNAVIRVTGRGQRPEISFSSTPALPEDELLSRLLFGTSITNLSAPEALQLAAAVAALNNGGTGLDPINALRGAVGLDRLRILPADIVTGQGTAIAAGKYLGRQVYVEVVTDARGYSATQLEFQITRWLSILGTLSTIGRQGVNVRVSRDY
ncbi:MAG TPA: translocation/assembly module TamB domain-containing protein [Allosphingosinicella sp.]|uniref:translocation/assembly module TamB domain-containing protein n=1 Tax=Allosphingosinicella sp. TaxID=2823234 RepID=UPI002EDA9AA1